VSQHTQPMLFNSHFPGKPLASMTLNLPVIYILSSVMVQTKTPSITFTIPTSLSRASPTFSSLQTPST